MYVHHHASRADDRHRAIHLPLLPACPATRRRTPARTAGRRSTSGRWSADSGWVEQPPIRDMARIQFGQSYLPDRGHHVPVADFNLRARGLDLLLPPRPALDRAAVRLTQHAAEGRVEPEARRAAADHGGRRAAPGTSRCRTITPGEIVALPLQHGQQIWVREHRFLAATGNISYDWYPSDIWFTTGQDSTTGRCTTRWGSTATCSARSRPRPVAAARAGQRVHPRSRGRARPCWSSRAPCSTGT